MSAVTMPVILEPLLYTNHEILQAKMLDWRHPSQDPQTGDQTQVSSQGKLLQVNNLPLKA